MAIASLALAGCSPQAQYAIEGAECRLIKEMPPPPACKEIPEKNGVGMDCQVGDIAPDRWGKCDEDVERNFTCLQDGRISFYKGDNGNPSWTMPANLCPELAAQIQAHPDSNVIEGPKIRLPEPKAKGDRT